MGSCLLDSSPSSLVSKAYRPVKKGCTHTHAQYSLLQRSSILVPSFTWENWDMEIIRDASRMLWQNQDRISHLPTPIPGLIPFHQSDKSFFWALSLSDNSCLLPQNFHLANKLQLNGCKSFKVPPSSPPVSQEDDKIPRRARGSVCWLDYLCFSLNILLLRLVCGRDRVSVIIPNPLDFFQFKTWLIYCHTCTGHGLGLMLIMGPVFQSFIICFCFNQSYLLWN